MKLQRELLVGLSVLLAAHANIRPAAADEYASKERSNAAVGHYARARAMLVEALAEFEQARHYARPDMLLDAEEWRLSIISRTEELNRILDPRPRISREGVRFTANKMLIRRERDRLPAVADGAQASNTYGEEQRKKEMKAARARLDQLQSEMEDKELEAVASGEGEDGSEPAPKKGAAKAKGGKHDRALDEAINSLNSLPSTKKDDEVKVEKTETTTTTTKKVDAPKPQGSAPAVVETEEEEVPAPPGTAEENLFGPAKEKSAANAAEGLPPAETAKKVEVTTTEKKVSLETAGKPKQLTEGQQDEVSKAIDDAIQQRVKTIESNGPKKMDGTEMDEE